MVQVMIVDDEEPVRRMLARLLARENFDCEVAADAAEARALLGKAQFDLVLSDVNMPGESGLAFVKDLLTEYPETAVIMITGLDDPALGRVAIELGAYGYMLKPFHSDEILINIANALRRRALEIQSSTHRERLEHMVQERTTALRSAIDRLQKAEIEVRASREETIRRLSKAAEFRHNETALHIERMSRYCALLARQLGMPAEGVELMRTASAMHDVGKIGTPDSILLKPGKLTPEEFEIMKQHSEIGYRILTGSDSDLLNLAATIAWTHHEKYDGSGYPQGLRGEDIPMEGRVCAIADVFDALTSKRVYKGAMGVEESTAIMRDGRGKHFDPAMLDLFLDALPEVLHIRDHFVDG
ncbi:MAG: response regulator [Deltaproteobacteria bacterium]|nr:response regulator [Deltaproteobacteria bacterium]